MSTVAPIACGFIMASSIVFAIATALGDPTNVGWVINGWSIASSVSFSLAGSMSDIFGRRNVMLAGQAISLIGSVRHVISVDIDYPQLQCSLLTLLYYLQIVAATARDLSALIAGSTLLGFSCGLVLVAYAAVPELCANKYRWVVVLECAQQHRNPLTGILARWESPLLRAS